MPLRADIAHLYPLKSAIEDLFGKRAWLALKETTSIQPWKKQIIKVLDAIELSVESTVEIRDAEWIGGIKENLNRGRDCVARAEDIDDILASFNAALLRHVFLQLGAAPFSHKLSEIVPLHPRNWTFTAFRSVQVVQSQAQKEQLFRMSQRKVIGFEAQLDLEAEYRASKSSLTYSQWCSARLP